jgi:Ca2+-binding RTX toxin-like protein
MVTAPNNPGGAMVTYSSSANDGLSGIKTFVTAPGSGNVFAIGTTTVQGSAIDFAGNSLTGSFQITVKSMGIGSDGNLWILAQVCGSNIYVNGTNPSAITVTGAGATGPFSLTAGHRVIIYGTNCADTITVDGSVDAEIRALAGNDTVTGGAGNDVIDGGLGDDMLTGASGNDVIFGGGGMDRLVGSAGHDILIAVGLNAQSSTFSAFDALRTTWLGKIKGVSATAYDATDTTVKDGVDQLTGGAGADWFIVGSDDKITDLGNVKKSLSTGWYGDDYVEILS